MASFAILLIAYLSLNSSLNLLNKVSSDMYQILRTCACILPS